MKTAEYTQEERLAPILFCPGCFATQDDSSGGGELVPQYCMNCGGQPITVPRWAALSIRQQASWVGKRYYPHEEDLGTRAELKASAEENRRLREALEWYAEPSIYQQEHFEGTGMEYPALIDGGHCARAALATAEAQP